MQDLFIPVILGTARNGRRSETVAERVVDTLKQRGVATELIDVADYPIAATTGESSGTSLDVYRDLMQRADGLVLVVPEYNHGYPGELKQLLDAEYGAYVRKPVGFVSVSAGMIGGARLVEQLRLVAAALRMVPVAPAVHVPEVADTMKNDSGFGPESLEGVLTTMLDEIEWFAAVLTPARAAS